MPDERDSWRPCRLSRLTLLLGGNLTMTNKCFPLDRSCASFGGTIASRIGRHTRDFNSRACGKRIRSRCSLNEQHEPDQLRKTLAALSSRKLCLHRRSPMDFDLPQWTSRYGRTARPERNDWRALAWLGSRLGLSGPGVGSELRQ
jgi:hypothetical protein